MSAAGLHFAVCPECGRWRAIVRTTAKLRTRRHTPCGIVVLPPAVEVRPL